MEQLDLNQEQNPENVEHSLGQAAAKAIILDEPSEHKERKHPPYEYTMDDFRDWYRPDILATDKKTVEHFREEAWNSYFKIASKGLERPDGAVNTDEAAKNMAAAEMEFENRPAKRLERILKTGIAQNDWLNPRNLKGNRPFKIISLDSAEDADDYRNRIDASFKFVFPESSEPLFVGFDATVQTDTDKLSDKLTRASNVATEKPLPFGFSTLRYAYDPITGERFASDQVLRYTIGLGPKMITTAERLSEDLSIANTLPVLELRFKVLSEMHEQSKLFRAMNATDQKALDIINRVGASAWQGLKAVSLQLINEDPKLDRVETKFRKFISLKEKKAELETLKASLKTAPADEKPEISKKINHLYGLLYNTISKAYRSGNAGTPDSQYGTLYSSIQDLTPKPSAK